MAYATTQSDASGNRFQARYCDVDNDANSKALMGNIYRTLSTDGGATFTDTDTDTEIVSFALILDSESAGSGGVAPEVTICKKLPLYRYRRGHLV